MIFDLYALAFATLCAGLVLLALSFMDRPTPVPRPYDWARDAPEFRYAKETHVQVKDD